MIITRHGNSLIKLVYADKTIAINPISKNSSQKAAKFGANIATAAVFHPDFNGFENAAFKGKEPFKISGPGEYEILDIFIKGFGLIANFLGEKEMLTTYTYLFDEINTVSVAPISNVEGFSNEAYEEFGKTDIFILPMGGGDVFSPKDAAKFVKQFSPKIIIPILCSDNDVDEFCDAMGVEKEGGDKLTIKQRDFSDEAKVRVFVIDIV